MKNSQFRNILYAITGRELFYAQGLAFELQKNKSSGFPWHIGIQSFGYQKAEDFGCTIWMPLDSINTKEQREGMAYVPSNDISGKFMYDYLDPSSAKCIQMRSKNKENNSLDEYLGFRDEPLNNKSVATLLDYFSYEDDFDIGDILLFDKYVIHKSVKLIEGSLEKRGAFVMRFIDQNSTYDKKRALDVESPRGIFNYDGCSTFHLDVCKTEDEIISKSDYFNNINDRLLKI